MSSVNNRRSGSGTDMQRRPTCLSWPSWLSCYRGETILRKWKRRLCECDFKFLYNIPVTSCYDGLQLFPVVVVSLALGWFRVTGTGAPWKQVLPSLTADLDLQYIVYTIGEGVLGFFSVRHLTCVNSLTIPVCVLHCQDTNGRLHLSRF